MSILTLVYGIGNAKVKRARRGMEKNWNRFSDSQKRFWGGHYDKKRWMAYRKKKFQKDVDNIQ